MGHFLHDYDVNRATWFYLSLLLIIAIYFRFSRVWSLRNLDLALLLSLSPGLVLVDAGHSLGYAWLFVVSGLLLVRLFCDSLFERRPRLEQNLNAPGLAFLAAAASAFLVGIVITTPPAASSVETVRRADNLIHRKDASTNGTGPAESGPTTSVVAATVLPLSNVVASGQSEHAQTPRQIELIAAQILAILAHAAIVAGLILLAKLHFGDLQTGIGMAALYLLLPCTAYDVGKVNYVLPAAFVLWAFVAWRRPLVAGGLMGLACGTLFFPAFLLPLWAAFYGRRGALRFAASFAIVGSLLLGSLALTSSDQHSFVRQTLGSINWSLLQFDSVESGFWSPRDAAYRIPVFATFLVMLAGITIWPLKKNLEHLLAGSTAIIVGTQFWYPQQGGVYVMWYLPMLLAVIFRPRLANLTPPVIAVRREEPQNAPAPASRELVGAGTSPRQFLR